MQVQRGGYFQLVAQHDPHLVAEVDVDARAGNLAVVGHGVAELAGLGLPGEFVGGELEDLRAVRGDLWLQWLVAGAFGRDWEVGDALLVHGGNLFWRHFAVRRVVGLGGSGRRGGSVRADGEGGAHARAGVAGLGAHHLIGARLEGVDLERGGVACLQRLAASDVGDHEVVGDRPGVRDGEGQRHTGRCGELGKLDRELRQRHVHACRSRGRRLGSFGEGQRDGHAQHQRQHRGDRCPQLGEPTGLTHRSCTLPCSFPETRSRDRGATRPCVGMIGGGACWR